MSKFIILFSLTILSTNLFSSEIKLHKLMNLLKKDGTIVLNKDMKKRGNSGFEIQRIEMVYDIQDENYSKLITDQTDKLLKEECWGLAQDGTDCDLYSLLSFDYHVEIFSGFQNAKAKRSFMAIINPELKKEVRKYLKFKYPDKLYGVSFHYLKVTSEASEPIGYEMFIIRGGAGRGVMKVPTLIIRLYYSYYLN